jgi:hypothetical protein
MPSNHARSCRHYGRGGATTISEEPKKLIDPDFSRRVDFAEFAAAGKPAGSFGEETILLVLSGKSVSAVDAHITHYRAQN